MEIPKTEADAYEEGCLEGQSMLAEKLISELAKETYIKRPLTYASAKYKIEKMEKIFQYCAPHVEQMWAAVIVGIIMDVDFKDTMKYKIKDL